MSRWRWLPPSEPGEDAVGLRVAVLINSVTAFASYLMVDPDAPVGVATAALALGSLVSHLRRNRNNFWLKWLLAFGMLYALYDALGNLARGQYDPRLSLARLLMWLQVLNAFDLPRRKNLRVALLVAGVLMIVTATLSRTALYAVPMATFALTLVWALQAAYSSELGARVPLRRAGWGVSALGVLAVVIALPLFAYAPRSARTLGGASLPLSVHIPLPDKLDSRVRDPQLASGSGAAHRSGRGAAGFSERMDLNVRGALSSRIVLRVKADRPSYWRAIAYDRYDGSGWTMSEPEHVTAVTSESPPLRLTRLKGHGAGAPLVQTFYIEADQGNVIFAAWSPQQLYFPTSLIWQDLYGGLRSPVLLQKDMYYSVISEPPLLEPKRLLREPFQPAPRALSRYLQLPPVSARLRQLADRLARPAPTPYRRLLAMRNYLQVGYRYRLEAGRAPEGREWADYFLFDQHEGFCEQFATALAVLGRLEGIPTRLVTGYATGDYNTLTGFYEVRERDAHAWVEAWIPNQGWVPLDPTPEAAASEEIAGSALPATNGRWGALLVLLAIAGAAAYAVMRRTGARSPVPVEHRQASRAYRRLRKRLGRHGVAPRADETAREWLVRVKASAAPHAEAIEDFVRAYEACRFGGADADLAGKARAIQRALGRPSGMGGRDREH